MLTRWRVPQYGFTPLHAAAQEGHSEVVQALAKEGANKEALDEVREGS